MKRILLLVGFLLCAITPSLAQQSGYGGDGKASSGATVSAFIKLYETPPTAATLAAGAGGTTTTGAHIVKVTCYTPGGETTGGTASSSVDTATAQFAISAIPLCSYAATGRRVYMNTVAAPTVFNRVSNGQIANNTATTLTVTDNDATIAGGAAIPTSNTALDTRVTFGQSGVIFSEPITPSSSSAVGLIIKGATSQSVATQQWQDSGGTAQLWVSSDSTGFVFNGSGYIRGETGNRIDINAADNSTTLFILQTTANGFIKLRGDQLLSFAGSTSNANTAADTAIYRAAGGVIEANLGTAGTNGWFQNRGGEGALTAAFTNATTTFASSNLSYTVIAGRSYRIHGIVAIANTTAGHGVQLDFNGGNATATTFWATATVLSGGTVTAGTLTSSSLAGVINFTSVTGTVYVVVDGYLKVNAAGTFILRAAEDSTGGASASLAAGSWIALSDTVLK